VEQSVGKFHDRLNQQQYHEIYAESDPELHSRVTETEFTTQLVNVHEQMGTITGKAYVLIDDGVWRAVTRAFSGGRERVAHGNLAASDAILANESFVWTVQNDSPRLVSYKWSKLCNKPCSLAFGVR
jgi:hypothetical protein